MTGFSRDDFADAQFQELADSFPVMIRRAGLNRRCEWFNRPWLEFTGRSIQEERGNGWPRGVHPEDLERCLRIYTTSFDARRPFAMEYRLRKADETYGWLLDNGAPFYRDGAFAGYFCSCVDVTEQRVLKERLEASIRSERMLRAELNHRVKNNMQMVISSLSLEAARAGPASEVLRNAAHRVHAIATVHDQLYALQQKDKVELGALIRKVVTTVVEALSGIRAELSFPAAPILIDLSHGSAIGLIVSEVLTNTLKHAVPKGAHVFKVQVIQGADHLQLLIGDDGPGFPAAVLHDRRSKDSLGLLLLRSLAKQAHAELVFENVGGAQVRLSFSPTRSVVSPDYVQPDLN